MTLTGDNNRIQEVESGKRELAKGTGQPIDGLRSGRIGYGDGFEDSGGIRVRWKILDSTMVELFNWRVEFLARAGVLLPERFRLPEVQCSNRLHS